MHSIVVPVRSGVFDIVSSILIGLALHSAIARAIQGIREVHHIRILKAGGIVAVGFPEHFWKSIAIWRASGFQGSYYTRAGASFASLLAIAVLLWLETLKDGATRGIYSQERVDWEARPGQPGTSALAVSDSIVQLGFQGCGNIEGGLLVKRAFAVAGGEILCSGNQYAPSSPVLHVLASAATVQVANAVSVCDATSGRAAAVGEACSAGYFDKKNGSFGICDVRRITPGDPLDGTRKCDIYRVPGVSDAEVMDIITKALNILNGRKSQDGDFAVYAAWLTRFDGATISRLKRTQAVTEVRPEYFIVAASLVLLSAVVIVASEVVKRADVSGVFDPCELSNLAALYESEFDGKNTCHDPDKILHISITSSGRRIQHLGRSDGTAEKWSGTERVLGSKWRVRNQESPNVNHRLL
jgi:hypothetical protein